MFTLKFAPLDVPLRRRLQTSAAVLFMIVIPFGGPFCLLLTIYMLLFTRLWWIFFLYISWVLIMDRKVEERGGRDITWMRSLVIWKLFKDYFPSRLNRAPWVEFEPEKNYLLCCFPHGIISAGPFTVFGNTYSEFNDYFPKHKIRLCTLRQNFYMPLFRELVLGLGGCSASEKSIKYLLNEPRGGNAVALVVGGIAEAYQCYPRTYRLVLKNRKGFIKIAIKNGSSLVPVLTFGETDTFDQYGGKNTKLKQYQERLRKYIGIAPIISAGRGIFQYSFGMLPHRKPLTMLVGPPIDVRKNEYPSEKEIDALHKLFIEKLNDLFEDNKRFYLQDCEDIHIEII